MHNLALRSRFGSRARHIGFIAMSLSMLSTGAYGQTNSSTTIYKEEGKLIRAPRAVGRLGTDLFGDKVNIYNGSLEFVQTDTSVPGSSALPVAVGRRLVVGQDAVDGMAFGNWELEIPHLHGFFSSAKGWTTGSGTTPNARCSSFGAPPTVSGSYGSNSTWVGPEYWHGSFMYVPGQGDQEMLRRSASYTLAPTSNPTAYPVVTRNNWAVRCTSTLDPQNGASGEGFIAVAPDGTEYRFDWLVSRTLPILTKSSSGPDNSVTSAPIEKASMSGGTLSAADSGSSRLLTGTGARPAPAAIGGNSLARVEVWILPTVVTDRFGNTVRYYYDSVNKWQLNSIVGSDADGSSRTITFGYSAVGSLRVSRITSVSDGTRTWTYAYDGTGSNLTTVTLPDNTTWQLGGMASLMFGISYAGDGNCDGPGMVNSGVIQGSMTHPSGATGQFTLTPTRQGRNSVTNQCQYNPVGPSYNAYYPRVFDSYALTSKTISGPGLPSMTWTTAYPQENSSWAPCSPCVSSKQVDVTDPAGNKTRYTFGTLFQQTEGQLQQVDVFDADGTLRRTTLTNYTEPISPRGVSYQHRGDGDMAARTTEVNKKTITQQGVNFTWDAGTNFNGYAQPTQVTRSNTLGQTRTEITDYDNNVSKWVLGQVKTVTESTTGLQMVANVYDAATANLTSVSRFGFPEKTMTYNADGTLATRSDGLNHTTQLLNYRRGIARNVSYPDGSSESATINDDGTIATTTDENGYTASYGYDVMGRLHSITPPADGGIGWNVTTIDFAPIGSTEFDLPAGHWRQDVRTGNGITSTYFDAFWRPVYTVTYDANDHANTADVVRQAFDSDGRTTFSAYPRRMGASMDTGVRTRYNALGQPVEVIADSELGTLTTTHTYGAGFRHTVTDPRGHTTTRGFQTFDSPSEDAISSISAPLGLSVSIDRDIFGKAKSITRSGNGNSATRSYVYDQYQRLCKTIEPETGAELVQYDAANNIAWRAPGQALTGATCDRASVGDAAKISFSYDAMNRLKTTSFGDGAPSISRTYTLDGLPETVASSGATWTTYYNHRRLPTTQVLTFGGQNYTIGTSYDANGNPASLNYPSENNPITTRSIDYAPDALGRPTRVGNFATSVRYHPGGAIASFTYGNGRQHTLTQNARNLPELSSDNGILQDRYGYDENGNVTSISDEAQAGATSRTLSYDDLDRLQTATAPRMWGNASYGYDLLDNILSSTVGGRTITYGYDGRNLLTTLSSNTPGYSFGIQYDNRGNVTQRNNQSFVFDLGNRLRSAPNKDSYVYDGYGRRVQTTAANGTVTVSVYSPQGQLLYTRRSGGTQPAQSTEYIYLHQHEIAEAKR